VINVLTEINLIFHRQGLRSYIDVDLCPKCPRQDNKGCCGYYSPVFYLTDLMFIKDRKPELLDYIRGLPRLTILDASVTVDSIPDWGDSYHCQFHTLDQGCLLSTELRESICRHFVCPGIGWWEEESLKAWHDYFEHLSQYEIMLNNALAGMIDHQGLSLRNADDWEPIFTLLDSHLDKNLFLEVPFGHHLPRHEQVKLRRPLLLGKEWKL
jgi:hypothetical protein